MDGVLVVDKPAGPTSHAVVARVRRALAERRIGHTGTLDPLATGVLALVIGRATRLSSFLTATSKDYVAGIRFGADTPTYDAEGRGRVDPATGQTVGLERPPEPAGLRAEAIREALRRFVGEYEQLPPPYSARKIAGVPAYRRARRNEPVERRPARVVVHSISLEEYAAGLATVRLTSAAGFYVRSLAHDLGATLGCGAYLESLRRTRVGDFTIEDAVRLDRIEAAGAAAARYVRPLSDLLPELPAVVLNERGVTRASHGNDVTPGDLRHRGEPPPADPAPRWRLLDETGRLLGIAERRAGGVLHPVVVLM